MIIARHPGFETRTMSKPGWESKITSVLHAGLWHTMATSAVAANLSPKFASVSSCARSLLLLSGWIVMSASEIRGG